MRLSITLAASVLTSTFAVAQSAHPSVLRLDPALDAIVSADAKVELVKGGFGFTEGPVWVQKGNEGYLLFTDIPGNVVWKLTPDGKASVYQRQVGYTGPEPLALGPASRTTAIPATIRCSRNSTRSAPTASPSTARAG